MQMEHLIPGREHPAVLPVKADPLVFLPLIPEDRESLACDAVNVKIRAVAVSLLVGPYRHFGNVRVHGSIRHDQHDVRTAPAAFIPWLELEVAQVRDEIGLPGVQAWSAQLQLPITFIEVFGSFPFLETERVPKDEFLIVI